MKKIIQFLSTNTITYTIISLLTYVFYGLIIGISLMPAVYIICRYISIIGLNSILNVFLFSLTLGVSIYVFFITALIVFGIAERILIIGFKPRQIFNWLGNICQMACLFRATYNFTKHSTAFYVWNSICKIILQNVRM